MRLSVQFAGDGQQLLKGRRQVAIDDDVVKQMAVVELDPLAATSHLGQLVVGESARRILVECGTGVGGRTGLAQNGETGRFDVDDVRLELARPKSFQRLVVRIQNASVAQLDDLLDAPVGRPVQVALVLAKLNKETVVNVALHLLAV